LIKNELYQEDVTQVANLNVPWEKLADKNILITGASGLLGSFFVDVIMFRNTHNGMNCHVYAVGRSLQHAKEEFRMYWENELFDFTSHDINKYLSINVNIGLDYIVHLASNTHPKAYSSDPIGTITSNIIGTKNLLDLAINHGTKRFIFASSNEVYGENRGDTELFSEDYCGYINSNTLRAGYPESKRCGEALCQAYIRQKGLDIVIPRFTRSYGPTMLKDDTKAISQFVKKGIKKENIILKSSGKQNYSYTYVADAVSGLFFVLLLGNKGEAYNVADESGNISLGNLASQIARISGTKVVFEAPDQNEKLGYSTATKALLDGTKIKGLGWKPLYDVKDGINHTLSILESEILEE